MESGDGLRVTKLEHIEDGDRAYWQANVTEDGRTTTYVCKFGSWGTVPDAAGWWREAPVHVAFALQQRVHRIERRDRRTREAVAA